VLATLFLLGNIIGGVPKWLRGRFAKPLFIGSIPIAASRDRSLKDLSLFICDICGRGYSKKLIKGNSWAIKAPPD
jgi:hypothetical protein